MVDFQRMLPGHLLPIPTNRTSLRRWLDREWDKTSHFFIFFIPTRYAHTGHILVVPFQLISVPLYAIVCMSFKPGGHTEWRSGSLGKRFLNLWYGSVLVWTPVSSLSCSLYFCLLSSGLIATLTYASFMPGSMLSNQRVDTVMKSSSSSLRFVHVMYTAIGVPSSSHMVVLSLVQCGEQKLTQRPIVLHQLHKSLFAG